GIIQMAFETGARGLFDGNRLADHAAENRRRTLGELEIDGSAGHIRLTGDAQILLRAHGANDWIDHPYAWHDHLFGGDCVYLTNKAALEAFRAGTTAENEAEAYLRNLEIVEAVYQSNETRGWVDL
ncbi:MAG: gfo/Idh/MocA family oxidoreductase, partial [Pseudomonadota bacterium]